MDIQPRPYAEILADTHCPSNQEVGCLEGCSGDTDCLIRIHEEGLCWKLAIFEPCEICHKIKMQDEGDKADWLYSQAKDQRMDFKGECE